MTDNNNKIQKLTLTVISVIFFKIVWTISKYILKRQHTHTSLRNFNPWLLAKQLSYFGIIWTLPIWNSSQSSKLHAPFKGRSSTLLIYSPPLWWAKKTKKNLRTSRLYSSNSATRKRCLSHFEWKKLHFIKEIRLTFVIL